MNLGGGLPYIRLQPTWPPARLFSCSSPLILINFIYFIICAREIPYPSSFRNNGQTR